MIITLIMIITGLTFSNDNRYLYVLAVINTNVNSNTNTNTNTYMNYSSYIVIYDINFHTNTVDDFKPSIGPIINTNTKTNIDTNTNTNTNNKDISNNDLLDMINKMMSSIDSRLNNIESILRYLNNDS